MNNKAILAALMSAVVLSGCGGGSDSPAPAPTTPQTPAPAAPAPAAPAPAPAAPAPAPSVGAFAYSGTWLYNVCTTERGLSAKAVLTLNKVSDIEYRAQAAFHQYSTTDCTGNVSAVLPRDRGYLRVIDRVKLADGTVVDRVTLVSDDPNTETEKTVSRVDGNTMLMPVLDTETLPRDAQGYVASINKAQYWTKIN